MSKYYEWDIFKGIYLEDSFVLAVDESNGQLTFCMDLVLTENHPEYSSPKEDEQYCFKRGQIVFPNLNSVKWISKNLHPFRDADGNYDYGNIDFFELRPGGYHLLGDWGEVIINSSEPKVVWASNSPMADVWLIEYVVDAAAHDYESAESIVVQVADWSAKNSVVVSPAEIRNAIHQAVQDGYLGAFAYSESEQNYKPQDVRESAVMSQYFLATKKGRGLLSE